MPRLNTIDPFVWLGPPDEGRAGSSGGGLMKAGDSTTRIVSTTANMRFLNFNFENEATSGDNRGMYLRHYYSGEGGGGDAVRFFATVNDVIAGTVRGAHISLDFAATGTVTGLGAALECTLHIPNQATQSGTLTALNLAINSDGSTSDPSGSVLSYIRISNQGDTTGDNNVDDDAYLFNITGHAAGSGTLFTVATNVTIDHAVKCLVDGTVYYLGLYDSLTG